MKVLIEYASNGMLVSTVEKSPIYTARNAWSNSTGISAWNRLSAKYTGRCCVSRQGIPVLSGTVKPLFPALYRWVSCTEVFDCHVGPSFLWQSEKYEVLPAGIQQIVLDRRYTKWDMVPLKYYSDMDSSLAVCYLYTGTVAARSSTVNTAVDYLSGKAIRILLEPLDLPTLKDNRICFLWSCCMTPGYEWRNCCLRNWAICRSNLQQRYTFSAKERSIANYTAEDMCFLDDCINKLTRRVLGSAYPEVLFDV